MRLKKKPELDRDSANISGISMALTRKATRSFILAMMNAIAEGYEIHLDGFGKLRLVEEGNEVMTTLLRRDASGKKVKKRVLIPKKLRVHFTKAAPFGALIRQRRSET